MDGDIPKLNCIFLLGPANSGKTLVANSIARSAIFYSDACNFNGKSSFEFAPLYNVRCALINEPMITDATVNTFKNILEGQSVTVDVKYREGRKLSKTPIVITSNKELVQYVTDQRSHAAALEARWYKYRMRTFNELAFCAKQLNPLMWLEYLNKFNLIEE